MPFVYEEYIDTCINSKVVGYIDKKIGKFRNERLAIKNGLITENIPIKQWVKNAVNSRYVIM